MDLLEYIDEHYLVRVERGSYGHVRSLKYMIIGIRYMF